MTLDSIALTDFGLYAGRQEICLSPPKPSKPIVLFGGFNGAGKTTLVDALQLVLFGPRARTTSRGRLAYADYLSRCIHAGAAQRRASVQLAFRHTSGGVEERYTLRRSWREDSAGKCCEEFRVLRDDRLAPAVADNWVAQVDNLLPYNIAHLFLFDGEQIERYASPDESATLVGTAIQNLLGLDLVEQLDKDMRVYERRKSTDLLDSDGRERLREAEADLHRLHDRLAAVQQQRAALRTHEIEPRRRELRALEEDFRRRGGDLFERRREIERALEDAAAVLRDNEEALRQLAGGALPLLLAAGLADSATERDRDEQSHQRALLVDQYLAERDDDVLRSLAEVGVAEKVIAPLRDHLAVNRAQRQYLCDRDEEMLRYLRAKRVPEYTIAPLREHLTVERTVNREVAEGGTLKLSHDARLALGVFHHATRPELADRATELLAQHAEMSADAESARALHDSLPQEEALHDVVRRRAAMADELARHEAQQQELGEETERIAREIERQERVVEGLLETDARQGERRDDRDRILRCTRQVRGTLGIFRRAMIERHIARIERLVLDSYQQLIRKTSLVTDLAIDPQTFALELKTRTGKPLRAENLSAGERQLLGIALLWGLAKASGRPLPTAIDTPLGRLDTGHRTHFVERYLPFASHQTLVFSTDEEIVGGYLKRLRPWIGRTYRLQYDDDAGLTRVAPGYFGREHTDGD